MVDPLSRPIQPFKWRRNRKPLSQDVRNTYRILVFTLLFLCIGSTGVYLYTNSLQPAKGYTLEQLQTDYESLQSKARKLERNVIEAQSLTHLQSSETFQNMEIPTNPDLSYVDENHLAENSSSTVND